MLRHTTLLLITTLSFLSFSFDTQDNNARVKFLIGKVQLMGKGKTSWKPVRLNQPVFSGDRIKTNLSSRMELEMPDGSVIKIHENTFFDVTSIKTKDSNNEDSQSFTLWAGNIWASFKKVVSTRQTRQIESPSAVVAIRGTTLEMGVDPNERTLIRVLEGQVSVRSKDVAGEVMVGSNQESTVEKGKAPTPPKTSSAPDESGNQSQSGDLILKVKPEKLQFSDPAVLTAGIPVSGQVTIGGTVLANGSPLTIQPNGSFRGRVQVQEGINEIKFLAKLADNETIQTLRVIVNTRRPEIRLSQPLVAGFTNRRDYSLSGAVFDATPKDKIKVFINKELVTEVLGQGTFNRTIILNEGRNDIQIAAVDFSKNITSVAERIFLDTVKPIFTVMEPAQPVYIRLEPPRPPDQNYSFTKERFIQIIRGLVIDPAPSSRIKRIMVNGKEIQPRSDGSFETEIMVLRGSADKKIENRLSFYVEDMAGNITRDNSRVIIVR